VAEVFNQYDKSSNYDYIWFSLTTLENVHKENVKLPGMKYNKNTSGDPEHLQHSFEGPPHFFVDIIVLES
jgi:hypothetical protein